jgi:hypothetical protein
VSTATQITRVFISYRHGEPDHGLAHELASGLEQVGYTVFIDDQIVWGENYNERILAELEASDVVLVLLSPRSIESPMVATEVEIAANRARETGRPRLLPLLINLSSGSALPFSLQGHFQGIQYRLYRTGDDVSRLISELGAAIDNRVAITPTKATASLSLRASRGALLLSVAVAISIPIALALRRPAPVPPQVKVVLALTDTRTAAKLGDLGGTVLARRHHAELVRLLDRDGALGVVFDLRFNQPSNSDDDTALRNSLASARLRIALTMPVDRQVDIAPDGVEARYAFIPPKLVLPERARNVRLGHSVPTRTGTVVSGFSLLMTDGVSGADVPFLGLAVLTAPGRTLQRNASSPSVTDGISTWSVDPSGVFRPDWEAAVEEVDYARLLNALRGQVPWAAEMVRGNLVVVGSNGATDLHQSFAVPSSPNSQANGDQTRRTPGSRLVARTLADLISQARASLAEGPP